MKKIFSAALALVCIWFASPALAALPSGYTELEYIEGTGTQYITTDITANQDTSAEIKFVPTSVYPSNAVFGARTSKTSDAFNVWLPGVDGGIVSNLGTLGAVTTNTEPILNEVYVMYLSKTRFAVNNLVTNISNVTDFVTPGGIQIFNIYGGAATVSASATSTNRIASGKVYYFKIWQNNTLTHNFIPAKNASGVVGMYDTVGNRFYTNAGTGEFVAGDPVTTCDGTIVNYVSATGTVSQSGTPTPDNPIEPVFYQQGNMVLRKVGDYADSYDATTGKITRRVGVKVLDGTENWVVSSSYLSGMYNLVIDGLYAVGQNDNVSSPYSSHFGHTTSWISAGARTKKVMSYKAGNTSVIGLGYDAASADNLEGFKSWLAAQKAAGTPVTVYYPLTTETTENWTESQYCNANEPIKIATTKYNESAFSPLNTALQNAISVVDSVVSNTITQAGRIATLQAQKQTRPNDIADDNEKCPAGKKCLLVEDASGIPHWYEIVENAWDVPVGYTQLQYLRSDGRAYINTNYSPTSKTRIEVVAKVDSGAGNINIVGSGRGTTGDSSTALLVINSLNNNTAEIKFDSAGAWIRSDNNMLEKNRLSLSATKFSVNGDVKETNNTTIPDTDNRPFYIFQRWRPLIESTNDKTQVYEFSIYENDILVRDFVPAKNPDGKVGMYDTVEGRFYENAGTGEFIGGPVAE